MKSRFRFVRQLIWSIFLGSLIHSGLCSQYKNVKLLSEYIHKIYTSEDGLPQNSGRALVQTYDGYIWIGTQDGLVRFNGAFFQVYNKNNTPALKHNDITALIETADSTLWIGTYGGLTSLKNGIFKYHPTQANQEPVIRAIIEDHTHNLWIGTMNAGLLKYRDGKFESISIEQGLSIDPVYSLGIDQQNNLWIGTSAGLDLYLADRFLSFTGQSELSNVAIRTIFVAQDTAIWIGTEAGLVRWKNGVLRKYTTSDGLSDNVILAVYEDKSKTLWVGTQRGGICQFVDKTFVPYRSSDGLSGDYVVSFLEDREGSLWVGTYIAGLNQFSKSKFINYTKRDGLPDCIIRALLKTRDGNVWIGTEGGGLLCFDGKKFKNFNTKNGFPNDFVNSLFEDSKGAIWIGTREGIVRYFKGTFHQYSRKNGLSQNYIRSICEDHEGHLWVGTMNGGVHRFELEKFVNYYTKGLPLKVIRSIFVDHNGAVWIGSNEALMRWKNGNITTLTTKDGLPAEPIYDIIEDQAHTLWMGSYGGGLIRIKDGAITRFTHVQGLSNDIVFNLIEDKNENIWLCSLQGISSVKKQMLNDFADGKINSIECTSYSSSDGMILSECSGNAYPGACMTSDGHLWFATPKGVVVVDPNNIQKNNLPPPIVVERVVIDRTDYSPYEYGQFPPGDGQVEFHYGGMSYRAPQKVNFRYMLEGFEKDWRNAGTRHGAFYTNLPPGKYIFRVTACNSDGVWNETGASFAFELKPHFYQSWWFYGLAIIGSCGMGFALYRLRVWQLLVREKMLKAYVTEAMAKIKVLNGLIPICASCKKIRDDKGYWSQLEEYINEHSEATFSHGVCPECAEKLYGGYLAQHKKQHENTQIQPPPSDSRKA